MDKQKSIKMYQTADILGKEIIQIEEVSELDRDKGEFVNEEEYELRVKLCLEDPDHSVYNWETASHALERFYKKIQELDKEYENKKILIVGHGFTINLYFAKLLGILDHMYERLSTNSFANWGIVRGQKVIKDIANLSTPACLRIDDNVPGFKSLL